MKHSQTQEGNIAERYVMGALSEEEQSSFEEHIVDCQECLDRVETAERFRRGLKAIVTENAELTTVLARTGLLAWLVHRRRWQQRALFAGVVLLLVSPAAVVYFAAVRGAHRDLDRMQASYAHLQREYAQQQQAEGKLKEQLQRSQHERYQIQLELDRERQSHTNALVAPAAGLPIFALNMVRGTGTEHTAPDNTVSLSPPAAGVILLLELEPDVTAQSYRATLLSHGRIVWNATNLKLSDKDTIAVSLNSRLLTPDSYLLELESCTKERRCYSAASYSFRVTVAR